MTGVIKSKVYIPIEDADIDTIKKAYTIKNRDEAVCDKCEYNGDDDSDMCSHCTANRGSIRMWDICCVKGKEYVTIPSGNLKRANKLLGIDFSQYKDLRCDKKFSCDLKWTGNLRHGEIVNDNPSANQVLITDTWLREDKRYGFICAPPRTGKSVIAVNISCRLGLRTLFIVHQTELLDNFMKSFERDTNLKELQFDTGKQLVKIIENKKDLLDDSIEVALVTYQKFIRDSAKKDINDLLKNKFGLIVVDEAHQAGALAYSKFLGQLDSKYRLGISATPLRKDALNYILLNTIGPTTVKSEATGLVPRIEIIETGCEYQSSEIWAYFIKNMVNCTERNRLILREVVNDLKEHKCILIPVDSLAHMKCLVDSINNHFKEDYAIGYSASTKERKKLLEDIDNGKYKVIVAIKSMIKQGIDLKLPSMIYIQSPMSAKDTTVGAPMFYQMGNRVCTPYSGKREPIIKIFIDPIKQSYFCFRSLMTKEVKGGLTGKGGNRPKYKMNEKTFKYCWEIVNKINKKRYTQDRRFNPEELI